MTEKAVHKKTFGPHTSTSYWLTIKRGKPIRCSSCTGPILVGARFVYRHGIPNRLPREWLCLDCAAGVKYKVSDRIRIVDKQTRQARRNPSLAAQRILNTLAHNGPLTKREIAHATSIGTKAVGRHLRVMLRNGLLDRAEIDPQRVEWSLTDTGQAQADDKATRLPAPPLLRYDAPPPEPRRGVIRLRGK
jgi:DNA-binding MarR family transcriptional regulator